MFNIINLLNSLFLESWSIDSKSEINFLVLKMGFCLLRQTGFLEVEDTSFGRQTRFISTKESWESNGEVSSILLHYGSIHRPFTLSLSTEMEDLSRNLCWELVSKEGYIAVWQKPLNNSCYLVRDPDIRPPLCDQDDNPDDLWYLLFAQPCHTSL